MIEQVVPVVPVSKIAVAEATLSKVGFTLAWQHNPGQNLMYAELTHPDGIAVQASESRGDGIGPVVVYFRVSNVDALAAQAGETAADRGLSIR